MSRTLRIILTQVDLLARDIVPLETATESPKLSKTGYSLNEFGKPLEIVVLVGSPASGKTFYCERYLRPKGYVSLVSPLERSEKHRNELTHISLFSEYISLQVSLFSPRSTHDSSHQREINRHRRCSRDSPFTSRLSRSSRPLISNQWYQTVLQMHLLRMCS